MQIIKVLPENLANQIAAGEVVQRPSSVVKELLENAIDANASEITLLVKDGGRTLIAVTDDGIGMNPVDAQMSFQRHATSKLSQFNDLFSLNTMGFRGEALASIAAVSHISLTTKQADASIGYCIKMEGGKRKLASETICPKGTHIEVKNLFFNVPARRNFLKSDTVEFHHIEDEFVHISIAHPELSFKLIHNEDIQYNLPKGNLKKRIIDILGKNAENKIFPISCNTDIVRIEGYIGKPETAKKTRGNQNFYVNTRFFKSSYFNHAIQSAFEGLIPEKTHPIYFIFLTVDPARIDVNIHPTKTEIKFEEERFIYSILHSTIRESLGKFNLSPSLDFELETAFDLPPGFEKKPIIEPTIKVDPLYNPFQESQNAKTNFQYSGNNKDFNVGQNTSSSQDWAAYYKINEEKQSPLLLDDTSTLNLDDIVLVGKFAICSNPQSAILIDLRKAAERVLYDDIINEFVKQPLHQQMLLFPFQKSISREEFRSIEENKNILFQLGFNFSLSEDLMIVNGVPEIIPENALDLCLNEIISKFSYSTDLKEDLAHLLVLTMVKQSILFLSLKGKTEAQFYIQKLLQCEDWSISPSNQKIILSLPLDKINQLFEKHV